MAGVKSELGATGKTVSAAVRLHRERMGWGFARLSRELARAGRDVPPLGLARIESGERRVDVDDLTALAVVFGISPITLLMPETTANNEHVIELTGTGVVTGKSLWSWLTASYPLSGSVLAFFNHALPPWEQNTLEGSLGARQRPPTSPRAAAYD